MKRTVMAVVEVEDSVNNGQVLDTLENKFIIGKNICSLRDAIVLDEDADYEHERYLNYLMNWIVGHHEDEFKGCSPAGFNEWLDNEDVDYEDVPDWRISEGEYELTDDGDIILGKEAAFNFKIGDYKRIEFLDDFGDTERIGTYRVIDKSNGKVFCEFIG